MKKTVKLLVAILCVNTSNSQSILDVYIEEGLKNNASIQQEVFKLDKNILALKEARSLYLPNITFMTDYYLAGGGRTVDFPAGDLLNPVYSTLNQLTSSNSFPMLENQNIQLNPNNFYDAKFRTSLPVFNLEIQYNCRIKKEQIDLQQLEIDLFQRELVKDIKISYFHYLQSDQAIKIYKSAIELLKENKRVNEVLVRNDKALRTSILRVENELVKYENLKRNAQYNSSIAKNYFNFLLNKELDADIVVDSSFTSVALIQNDILSVKLREELTKLQIADRINTNVLLLTKSYIVPKISTFIDLGSQGFDWQFDADSRYYFFGVTMKWDVFSSGKNYYRVQQSELDQSILFSQRDYVESQLQLQLKSAISNFNSAISNYESSVSNFEISQVYYNDILLLYKEGTAMNIELLDAQNQLFQAELQVNISLFDTYIKSADVERANASFNLNK
jgi:outer membrane protein TolC